MVYFYLIIAGVLLLTSSIHGCPNCSNECEAGFMNCVSCTCAPSCELLQCTPPRECVLKATECHSLPCPKMPSCIDTSKVCAGSPLRSDEDAVIQCGSSNVMCPPRYTCTPVSGHSISVCCMNAFDGNAQVPPFPEMNIFTPILSSVPPEDTDEESWGECMECPLDPCQVASCPDFPEAMCVTNDCDCSSWFIDHNQQKVDCYKSDPGMNLPPNFNPEMFFTTTTKYLAPTPTPLNSNYPEDGAKEGVMSDVVMLLIVASCVVFLCGIAMIIYRVVVRRRKQKSMHNQEDEQLKSLKNGEKPQIA